MFQKLRTYHRCVDWNGLAGLDKALSIIRTYHRCVDWNTFALTLSVSNWSSHLSQVRGLKLTRSSRLVDHVFAPITGAWIETSTLGPPVKCAVSHLSQVRGLKLDIHTNQKAAYLRTYHRCVDWNSISLVISSTGFSSHLSQVRGLKLILSWRTYLNNFAPITGAWIETPQNNFNEQTDRIRTYHRCVDWNINKLASL